MHSPAAATLRLVIVLAWSLLMVPCYSAVFAFGHRSIGLCRRLARWYWVGMRRIVAIEVVVRGTPCLPRPALFVANHTSYLDIVVLGSLLEAAFVAKTEVSGWPGIGVLAKLGRTVFVDRRRRSSRAQRDSMVERLAQQGESLILFPEGTSNDGNRVLPFKSALLSVAQAQMDGSVALPVQPISISYTRLAGLPLGRGWRPFFAWYGDMELASHLWFVLGLGRVRVEVDFHAPVALADFGSRKALSDHCYSVIARGVMMANAGRPLPIPPPPLPPTAPSTETVAVG